MNLTVLIFFYNSISPTRLLSLNIANIFLFYFQCRLIQKWTTFSSTLNRLKSIPLGHPSFYFKWHFDVFDLGKFIQWMYCFLNYIFMAIRFLIYRMIVTWIIPIYIQQDCFWYYNGCYLQLKYQFQVFFVFRHSDLYLVTHSTTFLLMLHILFACEGKSINFFNY